MCFSVPSQLTILQCFTQYWKKWFFSVAAYISAAQQNGHDIGANNQSLFFDGVD